MQSFLIRRTVFWRLCLGTNSVFCSMKGRRKKMQNGCAEFLCVDDICKIFLQNSGVSTISAKFTNRQHGAQVYTPVAELMYPAEGDTFCRGSTERVYPAEFAAWNSARYAHLQAELCSPEKHGGKRMLCLKAVRKQGTEVPDSL